ncbi:MAG TPA: hypothetical protein ENO12_00040 [Thermoplasmatales archaeon]|nr:hypothetical protein [Thermoplasmatales archaeon]
MGRKHLIGISIIAVVVLIVASLTNVVGYQTVQSSNQRIIKEKGNQGALLFQPIVDIANNKEFQRTILRSLMSRGIFPNSDGHFSIAQNQRTQMYVIGVILSTIGSKSQMHAIVGTYQFSTQEIQKGNTIVPDYLKYFEKNSTLNIIKIILGFILAVIMMASALMAIPISLCINTLLKLGILPRLEGVLEYAFVFFFIVAFFCWAIIPDEFWDWLYNLFPFVFKSTLLEARGATCIS